MYSTEAFARCSVDAKFEKITIQRNECGPDDVEFDILYCGICHSDVSYALNHMGDTVYPISPGHELTGKVLKVGTNVTRVTVGDKVGVGCVVDSCMTCAMCNNGDENYCENGFTYTYNYEPKHGHIKTDKGYTFGGYSRRFTIHERYIIKIPDSYDLKYAGPIFCAGITVYSPLKYFGAGKGGKRVGIIGIGGLGQMAIRLAIAIGNEVTAISTNPNKEGAVKELLGAKHFLLSTDAKMMKEKYKSFDLLLNTISAEHQCGKYMPLLANNGTLVQLGLVTEPQKIDQIPMMACRTSLAGSLIGGIPETQELMDLCAEKNIKPEIEIITADRLDEVFDILNNKNNSITRYVLDLKNSS